MVTINELLDTHIGEGNKTQGDTWKVLRQAVLERDGYVCRECGGKANTVHHKQYGLIGEGDLISVCPSCHMRLHGLDPELTSRSTREMRELPATITSLERRLAEAKGELEAIIKGNIVIRTPAGIQYQYGISDKHWRRRYIADLKQRLKDMKATLKHLQAKDAQAKLCTAKGKSPGRPADLTRPTPDSLKKAPLRLKPSP